MLTTLTIDNREKSIFRRKPLCFLPANSLKLSEKFAGDLRVRSLLYINRRGKLSLNRIARRIGETTVLYSGSDIKEAPGINFFSAEKFRGRLCANMAIACLEALSKKPLPIKIGLYDPLGEAVDLPEHFLKFTHEVFVVTDSVELYRDRAQEIMWERGAPLSVSRRREVLSRCDLIVAPHRITTGFIVKNNAVVLTCARPEKSLSCRVYYRYDFKLPPPFHELKPDGIDTELFAAGLYEICKIYSLGNTVPLLCRGDFDTQTYLSLGRIIKDVKST